MQPSRRAGPRDAFPSLDEKVERARVLLQRTNELHPAFERRVRNLVELVDRRNGAQSKSRPGIEVPKGQ
jgi:hypothetical protein